ncbi:MAG: hypothetical protein AAB966_04510, partial [Patescibacteria group bacterium]
MAEHNERPIPKDEPIKPVEEPRTEQTRRPTERELPDKSHPNNEEMGEHKFDQDWNNYYRTFLEQGDQETVKALYTLNGLDVLVQKITGEAQAKFHARHHRAPEGTELEEEISRIMEGKIVLTFSKMFSRVDRERPREDFETIKRKGGFYDNIESATEHFKTAIRAMSLRLENEAKHLPEGLMDKAFLRLHAIRDLGQKEIDTNDPDNPKKLITVTKCIPTPGRQEVGLSEFLDNIANQLDTEDHIREYLHNVRSFYFQQGGENGFWGQLGAYAEKINSGDIDTMMHLPDSDKFMTAFRLYTKYLEEEFVQNGWIHQSDMFSDDFFKIESEFQQRVSEDLKQFYPELDDGGEQWRLRRALSMGIGLAKGIWLSEVETAAWADPNVTFDKGLPTFRSYYTNDTAALTPLNPLHHFLRWQAEGVDKGPLIYMPVWMTDPKLMRKWDHTKLWENLEAFKASFLEGKIDQKMTGGTMFIDVLPNIGRGGSLITRGGWRMVAATEGWL